MLSVFWFQKQCSLHYAHEAPALGSISWARLGQEQTLTRAAMLDSLQALLSAGLTSYFQSPLQVAPVKPSRPKRHLSSAGTIESVNLDAIPLAIARLDNSAAKHKLSIKPKNKRVSRKHRRLVGVCMAWQTS